MIQNRPNEVLAVVEKVVYHGFVSHLYLRRSNGDPIIAFQQNESAASGQIVAPGDAVLASWAEDSNHIVRDEATLP
jgi:putative spermidine/putrescine transport system ATP-binding protein